MIPTRNDVIGRQKSRRVRLALEERLLQKILNESLMTQYLLQRFSCDLYITNVRLSEVGFPWCGYLQT